MECKNHRAGVVRLNLGQSLLSSFEALSTSRLKFGPWGQDLGLDAEILALRLGFGPRDWDLGLGIGI